jgi:nicotinic acid phosphoribosyltransferase
MSIGDGPFYSFLNKGSDLNNSLITDEYFIQKISALFKHDPKLYI